jgi:single-strand DNA-binding protein
MASYNKVILMGNLTRDPELKYLPSGAAVANVGIAVNRVYNDRQSGEKKEEVCFVDLDAFGRTAEIINEYFQKGRPILVEGRLRLQTWETDDGQRRSKHSVFVDRFEFVGGRQDGDGDGGGAYDQASPAAAPSSTQFSGEEAPSTTDDDIPF